MCVFLYIKLDLLVSKLSFFDLGFGNFYYFILIFMRVNMKCNWNEKVL